VVLITVEGFLVLERWQLGKADSVLRLHAEAIVASSIHRDLG
jgi:hypothetical protein